MIAARRQSGVSAWLWACALALVWPASGRCQADFVFGGNVAATSDYIYRGVSESDGQGALQADLHASTAGGTFGGVWASSRDRSLEPGTPAELQAYLGQRFSLGNAWSATVSARADYFVGGPTQHSDDYQEISAALTWLDRWTVSLTAIPNAVRYSTVLFQYPGYQLQYYEVYRSPAYLVDGAGQWLVREGLLGGAGLYLTAAAGYYYATRPESAPVPGLGYLYGNAGVALEWRRWRVDLGYFAAAHRAAELFPYPVANRLAGTVSWTF